MTNSLRDQWQTPFLLSHGEQRPYNHLILSDYLVNLSLLCHFENGDIGKLSADSTRAKFYIVSV